MHAPTEQREAKTTKPSTSESRRGLGLLELLFAAAVLGATVPVAAWAAEPKLPYWMGD